MARKEINIFGTSFLDLLSGALGAVIILFIIVPKMSVQQQEALEELENLSVQIEQLDELMTQLENSVPQDVYEQIEQQLEALQATVSTLTTEVEQLQAENSSLRSELENLRQQIRQYQNVAQENETAQQRIRELEQRIEELEEAAESQETGGMFFGTNAELGIVCSWMENNVDVDLHVKNLHSGEICNFRNKNFSWGNLLEDVRSRSTGDNRYELFYQRELTPGDYKIVVNIYSEMSTPWNGTPANVSGYVVIHPGKRNQKKIEFSDIRLTQPMQGVTVGTLTVTNNNIYLQ